MITTKQLIDGRGNQKLYSGVILQSLISDLWDSMDSEMQAMKGILILSHAARYLERINEGTL